jgi:hypothetical protein
MQVLGGYRNLLAKRKQKFHGMVATAGLSNVDPRPLLQRQQVLSRSPVGVVYAKVRRLRINPSLACSTPCESLILSLVTLIGMRKDVKE